MILTDEEVYVVWAAMVAMVEEIHQPQDNLSHDQWDMAERLLSEMSSMVDEKDEARK